MGGKGPKKTEPDSSEKGGTLVLEAICRRGGGEQAGEKWDGEKNREKEGP